MTMTKVISAFPGTGKSYFHQNSNLDILDSDSSKYSWISEGVRNPDFPDNYMAHIKGKIGSADIILVSRSSSPPFQLDLEVSYEPDDGVYDGPVLRRIRMSRGVELEEISAFTKISELNLHFIEENRYHDLPAPVYVLGFLREFAKCLNLDIQRITESYMRRYREQTGRP